MERKLEKIWVTKYALTTGIFSEMAELDDEMASTPHNYETGEYANSFFGNDWHKTEEAAKARAEEMRLKKIASLKKQIQKLEKMTF